MLPSQLGEVPIPDSSFDTSSASSLSLHLDCGWEDRMWWERLINRKGGGGGGAERFPGDW